MHSNENPFLTQFHTLKDVYVYFSQIQLPEESAASEGRDPRFETPISGSWMFHAEPVAILGKASEIPLGCMNKNFLESGRLAEVQLENMRPQRRKEGFVAGGSIKTSAALTA